MIRSIDFREPKLYDHISKHKTMSHINSITTIKINDINTFNYVDKYNMELEFLNGLNKINIFVGENNSGKSRFMRRILIHNITKFYDDINSIVSEEVNKCKSKIIVELQTLISNAKIVDIENVVNIENLGKYNLLQFYEEAYNVVKYLCYLENNLDIQFNKDSLINYMNNYISYFKHNAFLTTSINRCYIPMLRGIENFEKFFGDKSGFEDVRMSESENRALNNYINKSKNIYENKISKIYFIEEKHIFTGEELYDDITNKLLGTQDERLLISEFQKFISENFYNGVEFSINPYKKGNYLNIKISDTDDRALYNMGDGIKQIIILLYKMYENKDNEMLFFIEEPEINLHPGFQRKLMEVFQSDIFAKHQIFLTTHSNHILDMSTETNNTSIFKFKNIESKYDKFSIEKVQSTDVSLLEELGVNNSSVFLANCTIWVEGISDRIYIKKYLELYFKENDINCYKEDINYAFVEYGGNNITHWNFLDDDNGNINAKYLNNHIFLLVDNDNTKPGSAKFERKKKLKEILGTNFYELESREIENLVSINILEKMLKTDNKIETLTYKNNKRKKPTESKYANPQAKIQEFIDSTYELNKKYTDSKDCLKDKVNFAKNIVTEIKTYDDLSEQAQELTEIIFKFIKDNNR